jgi:sugar O-acyltransferase (sialic acid O-acetyltransferase NeuD family)
MPKSIIIGAGTQGQVFSSYLKEAGINIYGFIDDDPKLEGKTINNLPILGKYEDLFSAKYKNKFQNIYCTFGNNFKRMKYLSSLKKEGYTIPSFFHHTVSIGPDVLMGEANYLLAGNIIMPFTTIGSYLMVNLGSTIAHHVTIGNGVFLSSGVNVGASVTIEDLAYISTGATIMTGVKNIGKNCLIGAGTVIIDDVLKNTVVVGNPGRVIRLKDDFI